MFRGLQLGIEIGQWLIHLSLDNSASVLDSKLLLVEHTSPIFGHLELLT